MRKDFGTSMRNDFGEKILEPSPRYPPGTHPLPRLPQTHPPPRYSPSHVPPIPPVTPHVPPPHLPPTPLPHVLPTHIPHCPLNTPTRTSNCSTGKRGGKGGAVSIGNFLYVFINSIKTRKKRNLVSEVLF